MLKWSLLDFAHWHMRLKSMLLTLLCVASFSSSFPLMRKELDAKRIGFFFFFLRYLISCIMCESIWPLQILIGQSSVCNCCFKCRMIIQKNPLVHSGGRYRPPHCLARYKSAILVAYRGQERYLRHFLYYLHPFLQRQQLSYSIYLIQQVGNGTFNRAKLLNVGVREAMKDEDWDCLLLHDVDLIPENDYNLYICDEYYPKHMASAMDKFQYNLPYKSFFGGVSALTPEHYMKMNGFPNTYWGDDGENDDIAIRIQLAGMKIVRTPSHLGHYKVMDYKEETEIQEPWRRKTWKDDGMNSLEFKLLSKKKHPLYTNITVDIGYVPPFS
uniref:Beta-1,4-galactosyltransferase n=1 Tax=Nothoprocta perdicaria TaxID=30464 RepID=A0A8C6YPI4_NOTPE